MCSESSPLQVERKYQKEEMLDEIEGVETCMGIGARQAEEQQKYHGPLVTILHGPTRPIWDIFIVQMSNGTSFGKSAEVESRGWRAED